MKLMIFIWILDLILGSYHFYWTICDSRSSIFSAPPPLHTWTNLGGPPLASPKKVLVLLAFRFPCHKLCRRRKKIWPLLYPTENVGPPKICAKIFFTQFHMKLGHHVLKQDPIHTGKENSVFGNISCSAINAGKLISMLGYFFTHLLFPVAIQLTDLFHCRQTHEDCVSTKSCKVLTGIISPRLLIHHFSLECFR